MTDNYMELHVFTSRPNMLISARYCLNKKVSAIVNAKINNIISRKCHSRRTNIRDAVKKRIADENRKTRERFTTKEMEWEKLVDHTLLN